jgi:hypothetical protein
MATQNPTPKARFQGSTNNITAHRKMVELPEFDRGIDFAKLQYLQYLTDTAPADLMSQNYLAACAACFQRVMGMNEFVSVLRNLSETPTLPPKVGSDNLTHQK